MRIVDHEIKRYVVRVKEFKDKSMACISPSHLLTVIIVQKAQGSP